MVDSFVVIAILSFFVGAISGAIFDQKSIELVLTAFLPALATLIAAFAGAGYAFKLQEKVREIRAKNERIASANKAIFNLSRMYNSLVNYDDQFLKSCRNDSASFLNVRPSIDLVKSDIQIDLDSLSFLLETSNRNILGELSSCVASYQVAIDAINDRSRIYRDQVQPRMESAGASEANKYTLDGLKAMMGERLYCILENATSQVFTHTENTIVEIKRVSELLTEAVKQEFPGHVIIKLATMKDMEKET